jgi:hypothetical protein
MKRLWCGLAVAVFVATMALVPLRASGVSGAIFTTVADGSEVNFNIYSAKEDVYLDGGPGKGAPTSAAGLPPGDYYFQVTDPSGKTLLSQDAIACRQFTVEPSGVISSTTCHLTGVDTNDGGITVQLMPYADTPNNGGEYKVWVTPVADYCNGACGHRSSFGFLPSRSKTDNFKVRGVPLEIDTRFHDAQGNLLDGRQITWTDTLGASNNKWSYEDLALQVYHEAHVEDVEVGTHYITIDNQAGCTVGDVYAAGVLQPTSGPQTVAVVVDSTSSSWPYSTFWIDVSCQ